MALRIRREHWQHDDDTWVTTQSTTTDCVTQADTMDDIIRDEYRVWGADDHTSESDAVVVLIRASDTGAAAWQRITILGVAP
jgi:hypothetical protein